MPTELSEAARLWLQFPLPESGDLPDEVLDHIAALEAKVALGEELFLAAGRIALCKMADRPPTPEEWRRLHGALKAMSPTDKEVDTILDAAREGGGE